jgi:CubicO group peptidase (beta-lactamase class C family)
VENKIQPSFDALDLDDLFQDYSRPNAPGAAIMIIKHGQVLAAKTYGFANIEEHIPVTTETNFRLASLTKQFTAMAIMILWERQKLSYEHHLTDFFHDFPAYGRAITLRHLLNHTSGLLDYETLVPPKTTRQLSDADVLALLSKQSRTEFPPGTRYKYSNSGYALLSCIVEKLSGLSFAEFLQQNIFTPLQMTHTVAHREGITTIPDRAFGYSSKNAAFPRTDQSLTSAVLGDGGIYSSLSDLYQWDRAVGTHQLVSRETLSLAFTPGALNNGQTIPYGFGWELNTWRGLKIHSHSGSTIGFRNFIARFPDHQLSLILLTNRSNALPEPTLDRILDHLLPSKIKDLPQPSLARHLLGIVPLDPF